MVSDSSDDSPQFSSLLQPASTGMVGVSRQDLRAGSVSPVPYPDPVGLPSGDCKPSCAAIADVSSGESSHSQLFTSPPPPYAPPPLYESPVAVPCDNGEYFSYMGGSVRYIAPALLGVAVFVATVGMIAQDFQCLQYEHESVVSKLDSATRYALHAVFKLAAQLLAGLRFG